MWSTAGTVSTHVLGVGWMPKIKNGITMLLKGFSVKTFELRTHFKTQKAPPISGFWVLFIEVLRIIFSNRASVIPFRF